MQAQGRPSGLWCLTCVLLAACSVSGLDTIVQAPSPSTAASGIDPAIKLTVNNTNFRDGDIVQVQALPDLEEFFVMVIYAEKLAAFFTKDTSLATLW